MATALQRPLARRQLLARLIESPDLVRAVRDLPAAAFSALVRQVGIEDAGELVALATTPQLVTAFDEDLFANAAPGERETFDPKRFATWLEVLLEAGDDVAAQRFSELSEDFVTQALSSLVLVLDNDALLLQMSESDEDDTRAVEKALESALTEDLDGYLLIARIHDGWDAALALILALDRDHRALLERVLDRCAAVSREYADDLDALLEVLTEGESLAEDVEAEREARRSESGYVEPRAARSFLALARQPLDPKPSRDPVTRAYFRDLAPPAAATAPDAGTAKLMGLLAEAEGLPTVGLRALAAGATATLDEGGASEIVEAMRGLADVAPKAYSERLEELAYLTNVLVAGATTDGERFGPAAAADAVLATIGLGADLMVNERRKPPGRRATVSEILEIVRHHPADVLFRRASSALVAAKIDTAVNGLVRDEREAEAARARMGSSTHT